jgi:hypothetical protein
MTSVGILERTAEEQQATQLIVCALLAIPIQGMEHHDVTTANRIQRAAFMFAVFVVTLFVACQLATKPLSDAAGVDFSAFEGKKKRGQGQHAAAPWRRDRKCALPETSKRKRMYRDLGGNRRMKVYSRSAYANPDALAYKGRGQATEEQTPRPVSRQGGSYAVNRP